MDENCMLYRYCCFGRKKNPVAASKKEDEQCKQNKKIRAENMNRSHLGNA